MGDRVADAVRAATDEIERARRLPDTVVNALRGSGLNRFFIPTSLGGLEAHVAQAMAVVERIAAVDGSAGWCAAIGMGSNVFAGYLQADAAAEIFADPDQANATMFAPAGRMTEVRGRIVLSGRWPFTSNCLHSAWAGLGARFDNAEATDPVPRVVFVPLTEVVIEDTWDAAGLRGTGSHHVVAAGIAVDRRQSARFSDRPWPDGDLWRLPIHAILFPVLAAVLLGIARGAVDEVARQTREGRDARRGQLADAPISLAELALADARLRAARAGLHDAVHRAHACAERGGPVGRQLQAHVFLAGLQACDTSVEVTSAAHHLGGGRAAYRGSCLLRALADVQTARQHLLFSHHHLAVLGKLVAGLDVGYPPYIM
jgi:alkylation response protein AidB-like acyl-CoA dehydrogenase